MGHSNRSVRRAMAAGASLAALCTVALAGQASAQDAAGSAPTNVQSAETAPSAAPNDNAVLGDELVVTARRQALETATLRKENAPTIIDSVVADEAGKLPDTSITEVLQRVSGVSIVRFAALGDPDHYSAEGSGIQIRGLSGVAAHLNGREVFSANGGRGLLWGDVTPEMMAAVDVYKDSTADIIEGGTGGSIDLRTKMPFDYRKPSVQATIAANRGDLASKWAGEGSILLTDTWETPIGRIGALVDLAYSKYKSADNFFRLEPYYHQTRAGEDYYVPGGFDFGEDAFERTRNGYYGALQWQPTSSLTFFTTLFDSKYKEENIASGEFVTSQNLSFDPSDPANQFDENGMFQKGNLFTVDPATGQRSGAAIAAGGNTGASKGTHDTFDWSTGFNWQATDRLKIGGAFQYVDSKSTRTNYDVFPGVNFPDQMGLDLTGSMPVLTLPSTAQAIFDDPTQYQWQATMTHAEQNHGRMAAGNIDVEYDLSDTGFFRSVKAGVRYADRTENDDISGYNWVALGRGWNGDPQKTFADARPGDVEERDFSNFFRGDLNIPFTLLAASHAMAGRYDVASDHAFYGNNGPGAYQGYEFFPQDASHGRTKTTNAYAMVSFASDSGVGGIPFNGNVGVRFVRNENKLNGFISQSSSTFERDGVVYTIPSVGFANSGGITTNDVLPSVNLQFLPGHNVHLRFAYNKTLDQPSFSVLRASGTTGVDLYSLAPDAPPGSVSQFRDFNLTLGNPNLKPQYSNNLDVSLEWYPKPSFNMHLAVFHKSIDDLLVFGSSVKQVPIVYTKADGTTETRVEQVNSSDYFNSPETATVRGVEFGGRKFFDELPGLFSGLGVEANVTYIDSKNPGAVAYGINNSAPDPVTGVNANPQPLTNNPIEGLSRYNFNLTGLYEKGHISARVAYSWRSKYLMTTNSNGTNGTYTSYNYPALSQAGPVSSVNDKIALPIYADAYGTLDAGITYKLNDHVGFSLDGTNLTNSTVRTLMGGYPGGKLYVRSYFIGDRRIAGTIRLSF